MAHVEKYLWILFVYEEFDLLTEMDFFKNCVFILKWRSSQALTCFR